jgi:hypothetical protein
MNPRLLLHLEAAAVLVASVFVYRKNGGGWLQFALLFLLPDLSKIGYDRNARLGAITSNAVHTYGGLSLGGFLEKPSELPSLFRLTIHEKLGWNGTNDGPNLYRVQAPLGSLRTCRTVSPDY